MRRDCDTLCCVEVVNFLVVVQSARRLPLLLTRGAEGVVRVILLLRDDRFVHGKLVRDMLLLPFTS